MAERTLIPRLTNIIEAIERIRSIITDVTVDAFEAGWQKRWPKVAGIGNALRHGYERITADVIWKLAQVDLPVFDSACRAGIKPE